jgi:NAD(P)-dependent dehydrogenase (short-subunit alcohol dehydrogenase family)
MRSSNRTGRVAVVTGATTGIGAATAQALASRGFTVYGTGRDASRVQESARVIPIQLDVTDEASMRRATQEILTREAHIDVLVNNAGHCLNGFLEDLPMADIRRQFETNVFGLIRMTQLVSPSMRAAGGGRVIHVGSVGGVITAPGAGAYHASKFAVEAIADVHRMELKRFGIEVVLVQPTGVDTPFLRKVLDTYPGTGVTSPYADQLEAHRATVASLGEAGPGFLVITAEKVAQAIAHQATARRPRTRVLVGASARAFVGIRRHVPDRVWDRMATSQLG